MCGITGLYNFQSQSKTAVSKTILKQMADQLAYRGPDDEGYFIDQRVGLAHRRLAIIDLSRAGHQPMYSLDRNLIIVFNGEIYNYLEIKTELQGLGYKFKSQTDTEVILAAYQAWGTDCLAHFNGMWAFVIYDRKKNLLFGSRDRLGVKPFHYYKDKNFFIFASEIKAILKHSAVVTAPNDRVIGDYLVSGLIDHSAQTFFEHIFELRGGHFFILQKGQLKIHRYWHLDHVKEIQPKKDQDYAKQFLSLFNDSIKLRLRSDVPLGTCLSGGLDSSAIVCAVNSALKKTGKMRQIGKWQKTFSSAYKLKQYEKFDERSYIKAVIRQTHAQASYIFPQGTQFGREISKIIYHHDAPFASTSIYAQWNVFRLAKSHKMKVMLDGQGSDELLGGYLTFFPFLFLSLKRRRKYLQLFLELIGFIRYHFRGALGGFLSTFFQFPSLKSLRRGSGLNLKSLYQGVYEEKSLFDKKWLSKYRAKTISLKKVAIKNPFLNHSYNLVVNDGLPALLRYEDRNSMAFSIESRTPFLDYRLVEFIYSLPDDQKIRLGQTKWIMRQALKHILPKEIYQRHSKLGFATPEDDWLKKELSLDMKKVFASKVFIQRPYFNGLKVGSAFEAFLSGEPLSGQMFWRIYNLELWLREYFK